MSKDTHLYKIIADYRKNNPAKPDYYVLAHSAKEAKQRFSAKITWLKIYSCEVVEDDEKAKHIIDNPRHYIWF